ncbi:hypothetical protein [Stutzerimonas stutzeri]|uniref:Tail fiber protein n=1 Tax=Stutzerimonas stutzeri TaxID=316 RepID=A0AA42PBH9_STUST|nr:hypothetical protein [Stutzerimonas stutzeri]MDH1237250.1 hypothetical protein [Stutzerimonas stutzeri]MDH1556840.1 hypothetical protein [Stutzerimonas stutzeri]OCX57217.1 hypothetical protein BFM99_14195 [Stutzerimonas stutzeri]
MSGPLDGFVAKTTELTRQVDVLISRVKALAEVGQAYQVEDAVEQARQAAIRAEDAANSILESNVSSAEDAARAETAAGVAEARAGEVVTMHNHLAEIAQTLPTDVAFVAGRADAAAISANAAQQSFAETVKAKEQALAARDQVAVGLDQVNLGVAAVAEVRESIATLNSNMAAAIASAAALQDIANQLGSAAFSSTYKFASLTPASSVTLDADIASIFRLNLTEVTTTVEISAVSGAADKARQLTVILRQGTGSNKVKWPTNIRWANNMAPVLSFTNGEEDVVTLLKCGNDNSYYGFFSGDSFNA